MLREAVVLDSATIEAANQFKWDFTAMCITPYKPT